MIPEGCRYTEEDMRLHRWYTIRTRTKFLRMYFELTQTELAKKIGVSQPVISQMENGNVSSETVLRIAEAFDVWPAQMIDHAGQTEREIEEDIMGSSYRAFYARSSGKKIGRKIADIRRKHNMLQDDLAKAIGVPQIRISNWENGRGLRPWGVRAIAAYFNLKPKDLVGNAKPGGRGRNHLNATE